MMTRELVEDYLGRRLSRRGFLGGLSRLGFGAGAATALVDSLAPLAAAATEGGAAAAAPALEGTGGQLLVEQLRAAGVRFLFNCNSSRTSPIFDALVDQPGLQVIQVPQEGQMVAVAQGYALAARQPAFATCGGVGFPGTLNNLYNAWKDRAPLVVGTQREQSRLQGGRDSFEDWDDFLSPSAAFTRWRWNVGQVDRIPEFVRRALRIALTPPQGPVALALPTEVLAETGRAPILPAAQFLTLPQLGPAPRQVEEAAALLLAARNPVILVGREVTGARGHDAVVQLAERLSLPVFQGDRLFDDFPTDHPLFLGNFRPAGLPDRPVDLVLSLGSHPPDGEETMPPGARLIHVSLDPESIGRVYPTELGLVADVRATAVDLLAAVNSAAPAVQLDQRAAERLAVVRPHAEALQARRRETARARWDLDPLSWERVGGELEQLLEPDAIVVTELDSSGYLGVAANAALAQLTFGPHAKSRIGKTTGSALGWGLGAALGVKLAQPDRQVVNLQGDGSFLFAQAETLWTLARYEVPVLVVIFNNRSYNGPRDRILAQGGAQARAGRELTCYLGQPDVDFARVAAGFGVAGEGVSGPAQLRPALQRGLAALREGRPYLLDVQVGRTGRGADSTWYPRYSVAAARRKAV